MSKFFQLFRIPALRKKVIIVMLWLALFRLLAAIPIPGVSEVSLRNFLQSNQLLGFLNIFSGGALSNLSIVMLGIGPYITATIILQLLTMIFPRLKKAYFEEGSAGRAKFNRYSRWLSVPLAGLQSYGFLNILKSQGVLGELGGIQLFLNVLVVATGSVILMWIGELISEQKIGNGISLIIFAGIVSSLPATIRTAVLNYTPSILPTYLVFIVLSIIIIGGVVYVNQGERKIPISYAKRIRGNKVIGGGSTYLPLKVNQAGVIPIIFAVSILLFPQFFAQIISIFSKTWSLRLNGWVTSLFNNQGIYAALYFVLVVAFTYFYTALTFDAKEVSKTLQRNGGFIPGIRPGEPTGNFLSGITKSITLFGALFLGLVAVLPTLTQIATGIQTLTIGGTALLIVVSVALEVMKQIDSQLVLREYEGIE